MTGPFFEHDLAITDEVHLLVSAQTTALVFDVAGHLHLERDLSFGELDRERVLIEQLKKPRPHYAVDLKGGANNRKGPRVANVSG